MIGLASLLDFFRATSLSFKGEYVVPPMDLVAALSAQGYSSEVLRVGTGLETWERSSTPGEEPRCAGSVTPLVVRSSSMVPTRVLCLSRGDSR